MASSPALTGQTLAHYRVLEKIGAGGMGEVYRGHDSKLGRDVAIKVLPEAFATDAERLARFQREAQMLAALNHPNIGAIYGLEHANGVHCLILELVEGETLAARLKSGPLPLGDALAICRQIAEALEAAHEKGIVHRDLKPGNVNLTPDGTVKVLDFGLAKAFGGDGVHRDISNSPTLTSPATYGAVLVGTAAYMSPEQARGRAVDRRADVWAFGCVLYELLTAQKAYDGETVSDTLAAVLRAEPEWSALPASIPASVHKLLRRCLQKDPKKRLRDIGDVRLELEEVLSGPAELPVAALAAAKVPRWKRILPWAIAGIFIFATAFANWQLKREWEKPDPPVTRFSVTLPAELGIGFGSRPSLAFSDDGRMLVYVAEDARGERLLHLRAFDSDDSQPLPGTEGAYSPFFSPDGRWVGFFARGNQLRKVPVAGGVSQPLSEGGPLARGAFWGADGFIYFNPGIGNGVQRVPENGGSAERLTALDTNKNEQSHQWPELLPGGRTLLFTVMAGDVRATRTDAFDLRSGARRTLLENGSQARYLPSGHLLYVQGEYLMGAPFDPEEARLLGPAVRVLQQLTIDPAVWAAQFAVSANGSLAFLKGGVAAAGRSFVWSDRKGTSKEVAGPARAYDQPVLSPDGRSMTATIRDTNPDIWVYDLTRSALSRLSFAAGEDETPLWFPDGKRIAWSADRERRTILAKAADGSGEEEQLAHPTGHSHLNSISPDGRFLTFSQAGGLGRAGPATSTGWDVWLLPLDGEKKPRALFATQFNESNAMFSADGRWLAYDSDESGRQEVYVQPFPGPGGKWQVSTDGGSEPHWVRQRKEIVYRNGDRFYAVAVQVSPTFSAGTPQLLFEGPYRRGLAPTFSVTADGQRLLLLKEGQNDRPREVHVVLNWQEELKRLLTRE